MPSKAAVLSLSVTMSKTAPKVLCWEKKAGKAAVELVEDEADEVENEHGPRVAEGQSYRDRGANNSQVPYDVWDVDRNEPVPLEEPLLAEVVHRDLARQSEACDRVPAAAQARLRRRALQGARALRCVLPVHEARVVRPKGVGVLVLLVFQKRLLEPRLALHHRNLSAEARHRNGNESQKETNARSQSRRVPKNSSLSRRARKRKREARRSTPRSFLSRWFVRSLASPSPPCCRGSGLCDTLWPLVSRDDRLPVARSPC